MTRVLAVDLGATSVRVAAIDLSREPEVEVLHRWHHSPVSDDAGSLRWDWNGIVEHVEHGLRMGIESGPVASIGVDGWGVDYGLIDERGDLVDLPFAYRDDRTTGWEETAERIGHECLYDITGVQLMGINTIFQLAADSADRLSSAHLLLLLPDLLVYHLTGWVGCEVSNLSTTGLMDARTRSWSDELIMAIGAPREIFPRAATAGSRVGAWEGVPVHLVGSHDTASAFLGAPFEPEVSSVFVSTGSWVIVGVEQEEPNTSPAARMLNFSNEAGAMGGVRFLKNVVGFWILEECRSAWGDPTIEDLIGECTSVDADVPLFDAGDHRFVRTNDMISEVTAAAAMDPQTPRPVIVRSIIESIVAGVVRVIEEIGEVTGTKPERVVLAGGGSRIPLVATLLAQQSGMSVVRASAEATALGNAATQGVALNVFTDVADSRRWLSATGVPV